VVTTLLSGQELNTCWESDFLSLKLSSDMQSAQPTLTVTQPKT